MKVTQRDIPFYTIQDMSDIEFRCLGHIVEYYLKHETTNTQEMEMTAKRLKAMIDFNTGKFDR